MAEQLIVEADPLDAIVDEIIGETEAETPEPDTGEIEATEGEETETPEAQDEPEAEFLEFKYRGQKVKKSLDEVLDLAEKGMGADLKFQEAAEMRKAVEADRQFLQQQAQFQEQFRTEIAQIAAMDMQLGRYKEVDWSAYTDQDPVEATKAWQRYQILQQQRGEMAQGLNLKQQHMQAAWAQQANQSLAEAARQLENEFGKEWNPETRAALKENAKAYGFNDEELGQVSDPRIVRVLMDAYRWRNLQSGKPAVNRKVADAPKLAKPGSKPQSGDSGRKQQLQKMLKSSTVRSTREKAAMALLDDFVK
jgi:hypothetical protein